MWSFKNLLTLETLIFGYTLITKVRLVHPMEGGTSWSGGTKVAAIPTISDVGTATTFFPPPQFLSRRRKFRSAACVLLAVSILVFDLLLKYFPVSQGFL